MINREQDGDVTWLIIAILGVAVVIVVLCLCLVLSLGLAFYSVSRNVVY